MLDGPHDVVTPTGTDTAVRATVPVKPPPAVKLTVDAAGVYWHPSGTDADLLVTPDVSSLRASLEEIARLTLARAGGGKAQAFR